MILLRLAFMVIFVIHEPTLGAEPNDKLDTLLSYMVQMRDDMKLLNQKVDGVQTEIIAVEKKVDKVERDTWIASFGWTFIGKGIAKTRDANHFYKDETALGECIEYCQKYREENGREWNGLIYNTDAGHCSCQKNSRGFVREIRSRLYRVA